MRNLVQQDVTLYSSSTHVQRWLDTVTRMLAHRHHLGKGRFPASSHHSPSHWNLKLHQEENKWRAPSPDPYENRSITATEEKLEMPGTSLTSGRWWCHPWEHPAFPTSALAISNRVEWKNRLVYSCQLSATNWCSWVGNGFEILKRLLVKMAERWGSLVPNKCPLSEMWHFSLFISSCSWTIKRKEWQYLCIHMYFWHMSQSEIQAKLGLKFESVPLCPLSPLWWHRGTVPG